MSPPTLEKELAPVACAMLRHSAKPGACIQQVVITFHPDLDSKSVVTAWKATVSSIDALQHGFEYDSEAPIGMVKRSVPNALEIKACPDDWSAWLTSDRTDPFDLKQGIPWRCHFFPDAHQWVWTFHHALLDGRSITEVLRCFLQRLAGNGDLGTRCLKLWPPADESMKSAAGRYYRDAATTLELHRPEMPDELLRPSKMTKSLGPGLLKLLEERANQFEVTTATVIIWAWGQAVALATGAKAVACGQVRAGAPQPERVGFAMNTLPLIIKRADDVEDSLREVRANLLGLRAFESISPEDLASLGWNPEEGPWPGGIIMVERGTLAHQVGHPELVKSILMHEHNGDPLLAAARMHPSLDLEVEVNGDTHGETTVKLLLQLWAEVLLRFTTAPETEPVVLPDSMASMLPTLESGGPDVGHFHLANAWKHAVRNFSSKPALVVGDESLTYKELDQRVEHLAARLETSGISNGDIVASELTDRRYFPIVLFAVARLGAIHLPIDADLPMERRRTIVNDAKPSLLVTDLPKEGGRHGVRTLKVTRTGTLQATSPLPENPREPLSILYTSGSTGLPKGVVMVNGGVCNEAIAMAQVAGLGPDQTLLQFASPGFDASLEEVLSTLLSGATLVPRPERLKTDLGEFHDFIHDAGITVLDLSTAHWAAWCSWMIAENRTVPPCVKTTIIGGERATASSLTEWFQSGGRNHRLLNTYGPTEASVVATVEIIEGDWDYQGDPPIGRPLPGVIARIADSNGFSLPPGMAGELWLGGNCIGPGYWERPERTEASFRDLDGTRWYRTGDRACWKPDGRLRFLGRVDEQLKIRGNRIEPAEVARVLESFEGVSAAHVGPVSRPDGSIALAAWVRWQGTPPEMWPAMLSRHASGQLPQASVPSRWAMVDDFKLTERGKLDRQHLPEANLTASQGHSGEAPSTTSEIRLAAIWSELLGIPKIGRDESFFELGGDSITALRMFAEVYREFQLRVPMASLVDAPSVRALAAFLDKRSECSRSPEAPLLQKIRSGSGPEPLICIHGGDGGVVFYRNLTKSLETTRPIVAIESPLLSVEGPLPEQEVEGIAESYLGAITEQQPSGPYFLLGYSYGGLLAYEIARQLNERGEKVAFVGMVDALNPAIPLRKLRLLERVSTFWKSTPDPSLTGRIGRLLTRAVEGVATHLRIRDETRRANNAGNTEPFSELRTLQVRETHWRSTLTFKPTRLDAPLHLFRSSTVSDKHVIPSDYGWGKLSTDLHIIEVQGHHLTMFDEENLGDLSSALSKILHPSRQ